MIGERTNWFHWYGDQLERGNIKPVEAGVKYSCPCCGYPTLSQRGGFEICALCFWEDDGQDEHNAELVLSGPNHDYSLTEARRNWERHQTMYRPDDTRAFTLQTDASQLRIKSAIRALLEDHRWAGRAAIDQDAKNRLKASLDTLSELRRRQYGQ